MSKFFEVKDMFDRPILLNLNSIVYLERTATGNAQITLVGNSKFLINETYENIRHVLKKK